MSKEPLVVNELHEALDELTDEQKQKFANWVKAKIAEDKDSGAPDNTSTKSE